MGSCSPDVVAVEARAHVTVTGASADTAVIVVPAERVVSLTERRLTTAAAREVPSDTRALPSVDAYDQVLTRARRRTS